MRVMPVVNELQVRKKLPRTSLLVIQKHVEKLWLQSPLKDNCSPQAMGDVMGK